MFTKDAQQASSDGTAVSAGPQAIEDSFKTQFKPGLSHIEQVVDQVPHSERMPLSRLANISSPARIVDAL